MAVLGTLPFGRFQFGLVPFEVEPVTIPTAPFERTFVLPQNGAVFEGAKTPAEVKNYSFNWAGILGEDDSIAQSVWSVNEELQNVISGIDPEASITTIVLAGGELTDEYYSSVYDVTNLITTLSGLQLEQTFRLFVNPYNV